MLGISLLEEFGAQQVGVACGAVVYFDASLLEYVEVVILIIGLLYLFANSDDASRHHGVDLLPRFDQLMIDMRLV